MPNIPDFKRERKSLDLSDPLIKQFIELPPYAHNENGELVNATSDPILVENGFINIQDYIDSFADDCDLYKILDRVAASGDMSLLNRKEGAYLDISGMPDNIHEASKMSEVANQKVNSLSAEEKAALFKILGIEIENKENVKEVNNDNINEEAQ